MKVCCLASGSKGNSTYIETDNLKILVDCGLGIRELEKKLSSIHVEAKDIDVILITHEHTDHVKGLPKFLEKYQPTVYVPEYSCINMVSKLKIKHSCIQINDEEFILRGTVISPIQLSHDSVNCFGYVITCSSGRVSIATDTGFLTYEALKVMKRSDVVIIESNYNETLLMNNPNYPIALKRRILSQKGHLSNRQCAESIEILFKLGCRQFVIAHLSEENNTPKLAYMDITQSLMPLGLVEGEDYFLDIAMQNSIGTFYSAETENSNLLKIVKS